MKAKFEIGDMVHLQGHGQVERAAFTQSGGMDYNVRVNGVLVIGVPEWALIEEQKEPA